VVGYHRRAPWPAPLPRPVAASNTFAFGSPWSLVIWSAGHEQPAVREESWPAQNNHDGAGTAVNPPVSGSHTCGSPFETPAQHWPFVVDECAAARSAAGNTVDHWPTRASGGGAEVGRRRGRRAAAGRGRSPSVIHHRQSGSVVGDRILAAANVRYRFRSLEGSEFNNTPKFVEGSVSHPRTMDVTSTA